MKLENLQKKRNELVKKRLIDYSPTSCSDIFFDGIPFELEQIWNGNSDLSFTTLKGIDHSFNLTEEQLIEAIQKEEDCIEKLEQILKPHQLTKEVN